MLFCEFLQTFGLQICEFIFNYEQFLTSEHTKKIAIIYFKFVTFIWNSWSFLRSVKHFFNLRFVFKFTNSNFVLSNIFWDAGTFVHPKNIYCGSEIFIKFGNIFWYLWTFVTYSWTFLNLPHLIKLTNIFVNTQTF